MKEKSKNDFPQKQEIQLWNVAAAVFLAMAAGWGLQAVWSALHWPLMFDDAYMFARYATHMRQGLGMAWNLDGVPTYGPTSLAWVAVAWVLSFVPVGTWTGMVVASFLCGSSAVVAMAWAIAANARTSMLRSVWRVLPLVAIPIMGETVFSHNATTGMETMSATLMSGICLGMTLLWSRGKVRAEWVGVAGFFSFLARPESGIAIVILVGLVFLLQPEGPLSRWSLLRSLIVFGSGVACDLLLCRGYFHTALPLSVYMKGRTAYVGFAPTFYPELMMLGFLGACQIYLVAMVMLTRRQEWRLVACCVTPALVVFAYLQTVTQIMGFHSRYYVPYIPYLVIPGVLVVERWWLSREYVPIRGLLVRGGVALMMVLVFVAVSSERVQAKVRHIEHRSHYVYDAPLLEIRATQTLPDKTWDAAMTGVTEMLVAPLPKGATVAATEVGYLGSRASQVNVIDMAGLNDTEIALHGFDAKALLARRPDLIWMPNSDYTYMRGQIFSEPELLARYEVYAGAGKFGLAVRKDSATYGLLMQQMHTYWRMEYPGTVMDDYRVRSASWSGKRYLVTGE